MLSKLGSQQRMFFAFLISAVFFVAYDYFFMPTSKNTQTVTVENNTSAQAYAPVAAVATPSVAKNTPPLSTYHPLAKIHTPESDYIIDTRGRIVQVELEDKKFNDEQGQKLHLYGADGARPLELRFSDAVLNDLAYKTPYTASVADVTVAQGGKGQLVLEQNLSSLSVRKTLTFDDKGHYTVAIELSNDAKYYIAVGAHPSTKSDKMMTFHGALVKEADETVTTVEDEDADGEQTFAKAKVAASVDQYYASALYDTKNGLTTVMMADGAKNPLLFVEGAKQLTLDGYIGPKYVQRLKELDPQLESVVEYGFFTFIAKPIFAGLNALYNVTGNWGWAIVILTMIIRIILFPLTFKGMMSMGKMKDLAPKLKEIQTKYKGDPQKLNIHMMDLYKKHGVNPLGGCLPMLLQIPIFFAIYRVLLNAIELKGAEWMLWIHDLSVMDPYYVLPILMGLSMFIQQKITPTTFTDELQKQIFTYLPVVFTFFFITFPAGLTLYWFINNIFSIGQQYTINGMLERRRHAKGSDDQN